MGRDDEERGKDAKEDDCDDAWDHEKFPFKFPRLTDESTFRPSRINPKWRSNATRAVCSENAKVPL